MGTLHDLGIKECREGGEDVHNTEMNSMNQLIHASVAARASVKSKPAVLSEDLLGQLACATPLVDL